MKKKVFFNFDHCHENITSPDLYEKEIIAFYNAFCISFPVLASIRLILKEIDLTQNCRYLTVGAQVPTLPWQVVYNDTWWKYVPKAVEIMYFWLIMSFCSIYVEHSWQQIWKKIWRFCRFLQISTTLRTITYSSYTTPAVPLSKKLHLLNTHQINDVLIASFSFSLNNNVLLPYFDEFCIENLTMHSYNTRESKQLHMIFNRPTNYGKYCTRER